MPSFSAAWRGVSSEAACIRSRVLRAYCTRGFGFAYTRISSRGSSIGTIGEKLRDGRQCFVVECGRRSGQACDCDHSTESNVDVTVPVTLVPRLSRPHFLFV